MVTYGANLDSSMNGIEAGTEEGAKVVLEEVAAGLSLTTAATGAPLSAVTGGASLAK